MSAIILDSNIVIYSIEPEYQHLRDVLREYDMHVSEISKLEVLGYSGLTDEEELNFHFFTHFTTVLPIETSIIQQAIKLRKTKKMSLGDAIIAGTALTHQLPILTRNDKDFTWINGLEIINPFD